MSDKNRNLEELLQFQTQYLQLCEQIQVLADRLKASMNEASVSLQDDVSRSALTRTEDICDKLVSMCGYGRSEMEKAASKTRAELDRWNNM